MLSTLNKGVFIIGRGKVGHALARACRKANVAVRLFRSRDSFPKEIDERLVIIAVRDPFIAQTAKTLARTSRLHKSCVVVHVSGALGPDALSALQGKCAGLAQMHPLLSFASDRANAPTDGGFLLVCGDASAQRSVRSFGSAVLRMRARSMAGLDRVGYHTAAGLLANGAAAIASISSELLIKSGVSRALVPRLLGPLLRSVAFNIERFGLPYALTGPVRRGDKAAVTKHASTIRKMIPNSFPLYRELLDAQWTLASQLGEADANDLEAIRAILLPKIPKRAGAAPRSKRARRSRKSKA